jgi:hypothetical protein
MGESRNSRADKMSGVVKAKRHRLEAMAKLGAERGINGLGEQNKQGPFGKKFYARKRRMFLKNQQNWEKI